MPSPINSTFIAEKNKLENTPVFLYTLHNYNDAGANLYFTDWDSDIVFDGVTYVKFPITHETIGENTTGEIEEVKLQVSNVDRTIQGYLETFDLRNKKVTIRMVWSNLLSDTSAKYDEIYYIDSYSASAEGVEFTLASRFDVLQVELPARKYWRNYCSWKFKSSECGYAGAETSCNKTLQRCRVLANQVRFGGFPAIPSRRAYIS